MRKTLGRRAVWQQRSGTQPQPHKDTRAFGLGWGTWPSDGNVHFCNVVCSISAREMTKNKPNNLWFFIPHLYKESKTGGAIQYKGSKRNPVKGVKRCFHTRLREQQRLGRHPARVWSNSSSSATSPNAVRLKAMRFQAENRAKRKTTLHFMYNYLTGSEFDSSEETFKHSKSRSNKKN